MKERRERLNEDTGKPSEGINTFSRLRAVLSASGVAASLGSNCLMQWPGSKRTSGELPENKTLKTFPSRSWVLAVESESSAAKLRGANMRFRGQVCNMGAV